MRRPHRFWHLLFSLGVAVPLGLTLLYRFVPPPVTPLMLLRAAQGEGLHQQWVPLSAMAPTLERAVIGAEDGKFCRHWGFDWTAIDHAVDRYEEGGRVLGASTISMQTAKNLFLWPGRDFLRKGLEAYLTLYLEALWPKDRILEVYLNVVELGPGLYGAEAASRHYFGHGAASLSRREAALLAALLPAPRRRLIIPPDPVTRAYTAIVERRAETISLGPRGGCP